MKKKRNDIFPVQGKWLEILFRMKLTLFILLFDGMQVFASARAQTISMKKQDASLEEIIWELKEKTRLVFLYSDEDIAAVRGITIDMEKVDVDRILTKCLENSGLHYVKSHHAIIIRKTETLPSGNTSSVRQRRQAACAFCLFRIYLSKH